MTSVHHRTCPICEANCGLVVEMEGRDVVRITPDKENPLSRGHICPNGTAIADLQDDPDRLRRPLRRNGESWTEIGWNEAFAEIVERVVAIRDAGGKTTMYVGNPAAHNFSALTQLPLFKMALGLPTTFSAATVDQMPNMVVQLWMFGHNFLYPIADVDRTMHLLVVGANPVVSNGSLLTAPGIRKRLDALRARGGRLVTVDPRLTETSEIADEHIFVRPGTDAAFLLAMLLVLDRHGRVRPGRLAPMLRDWDVAWEALRGFEIAALSGLCGVPVATIERAALDMADAESASVYGRMGVSTQSFGALCQWLIQLLNIATGNLDRVGGALFGQPPLDVVSLTPPGSYDRFRSRVRGRPETMNEFPVASLAEEIATAGDGQIRGLFTFAGNPVLSTPDGGALDAALATLGLMVSIDIYMTETSRHAHFILPPCGPLENDHYPWYLGPMMVRSFAAYSPAILPREEGTLADWEILQRLALMLSGALGTEIPPPVTPRAALDRALRASPRGLTLAEVEAHPHGLDLGPLAPSLPGRLRTDDGLIHCAPEACIADLDRLHACLATPIDADQLLLVGRRQVRSNNSWMHNSMRLAKGPERCTLFLHREDAEARGIGDGDLVEVASESGAVTVPVEIVDGIMPGVASLPHGFGHMRAGVRERVARERQPGVSFNDLTSRGSIDQISGNAAFNGVPVKVRPTRDADLPQPAT